jgi:hypothetical protein
MAEYLDIDPTVVRILWILSALLGGFTILLYVILAFIIPLEPVAMPGSGFPAGAAGAAGVAGEPGTGGPGTGEPGTAQPIAGWYHGEATTAGWPTHAWITPAHDQVPDRGRGQAGIVVGVLLVVFGAVAMANVLIPGLAIGGLLGPGFLLALGVALLAGSVRRPSPDR